MRRIAALAACDTVIADPPRQGLDARLLEALIAQPPERLIYASCDATTFLAQARTLTQRSPLRLRELLAFELFPQTRHVETLALFTRERPPALAVRSRLNPPFIGNLAADERAADAIESS